MLRQSATKCYGSVALGRMATNPDFVAYLRTQNFDADQAQDVAEKLALSGLYSASDFLSFYSTRGTDLHHWWNDQAGWQSQGNILARLRHMFDNLEASAAAAKQHDACSWTQRSTTPSTNRPTTPLHVPGCPCTATDYTLHKKEHTRSWAVCGAHCLAGR